MPKNKNIEVTRELRKVKKTRNLDQRTKNAFSSLVDKGDRRSNKNSNIADEAAKSMAIISNLRRINQSVASNKSDIRFLTQLFPDIELAIQILVSNIISPKDMTQSTLFFTSDLKWLPPELQAGMLDYYKSYMESNYGLMSNLTSIIRKVLFETGSHATAIIPDKVARSVIHNATGVGFESSLENINPSSGALGLAVSGSIALEHDGDLWQLDILDSVGLLAVPDPGIVKNHNRVMEKSGIATVGLEASSDRSIEVDKLFAEVTTKRLLQKLPHTSAVLGNSDGKPVVIGLPSESVMPVYVTGNPEAHIGYFILVDSAGNPVVGKDGIDENEMSKYRIVDFTRDRSSARSVAGKLSFRTSGGRNDKAALEAFRDIVENELKTKLKTVADGDNVSLDAPEEIYRTMLQRAISKQKTRLIYVPEEMISYIAYRYNENGTGRTLIEDVMLLASMRAILLFTKLMASAKNSIAITRVNIKLDENDPDPSATIEKTISEIMATRQSYLPVGVLNPADLTDWVHRAGIEFSFEGHPGLPDVGLDFSYEKPSHEVPDDDFEESLRKVIIMAFGLNPEIVDNAFSPEFATTVVSNNILLSKRVRRMQEVFGSKLDDYVYKLGIFDENLKSELRESVKANMKDVKKLIKSTSGIGEIKGISDDELVTRVVEAFIASVNVSFPNTDETDIENLKEAFSNYKDALEVVIDSVVSEEAIPSELAGDVSDILDTLKEVLKHYYLRKWMAENNFMPEVLDVIAYSKDGDAKLDIYEVVSTHVKGLGKNTATFMKEVKKIRAKLDKELEKLEEEEEEEENTPADNEDTGVEETTEEEPTDEG